MSSPLIIEVLTAEEPNNIISEVIKYDNYIICDEQKDSIISLFINGREFKFNN